MSALGIFQYIFKAGACYGLFRYGDMMLQAIGVMLAIGFILELIYTIQKMDRLTN